MAYSRERIVLCTECENAAAGTKLGAKSGRKAVGVACDRGVVGFEEVGKVIMSLEFLKTKFWIGVDLGECKCYFLALFW